MSWWTVEPAMLQALDDADLDVVACKKFWIYTTMHMAHLMGDVDPPRCPAPWMNLPKLSELCDDIAAALDSVKTKEELSSLLWSWFAYMNRLNRWFFLIFPWEVGDKFKRKSKEEVQALVDSGELPPEVLSGVWAQTGK
jgi:hypothetical protein